MNAFKNFLFLRDPLQKKRINDIFFGKIEIFNSLLFKIFNDVLILKHLHNSTLNKEVFFHENFKLQIHYMDKYTDKKSVCIFWKWILFSWFDYFLSIGFRKLCKVIITEGKDAIYLKGIVALPILEIKPQNEYVTCPLCNGKFRYLYQKADVSMGSCSECLKTKHLKLLENDWSFGSKTNHLQLSLGKYIISKYAMGSFAYAIENWNNWEYSITLKIK